MKIITTRAAAVVLSVFYACMLPENKTNLQ